MNINLNYDDQNIRRTHDERIIKRRKARGSLMLGIFIIIGCIIIGSLKKEFKITNSTIIDFIDLVVLILMLIGMFMIGRSYYMFYIYKE